MLIRLNALSQDSISKAIARIDKIQLQIIEKNEGTKIPLKQKDYKLISGGISNCRQTRQKKSISP